MTPINVIIAEDQKLVRQLLSSDLKRENIITIGEVENGAQLIDLLQSITPDIVLLDIEMPLMDGAQALEIIKVNYPDQKVIMLTMHGGSVNHKYYLDRGASAFLTKFDDSRTVFDTIRSVHSNSYQPPVFSKAVDFKFSKRETEMIPLICEGKSNKEIADELNIVNKTVEAHKKSLFKKTNTFSAVSFVRLMVEKGWHLFR